MVLQTSRSPRGDIIIRTNECANPRVDGQTGWQNLWFGQGGTGTSTISAGTGSGGALEKTWTNTPSNMEDAGWRYAHAGFTAGLQKTCSAYIYPNGFEPKAAIKARYYDSAGALIRYDTSPIAQLRLASLLGWQRISGTFTAPAGTVRTDVDVVLMPGNNAQSGQGIALQRILIEPGAVLGTYFDGTTYASGNGTQHTGWAGTAFNSSSLLYDWDPATLVQPTLVLGYDVSQDGRNVIHQLIDGSVAAALYPASTRKGILKLFFDTAAAADTARRAHAGVGTWTFTDSDNPTEAMTYAVAGTMRKYQSDNRKRWTLEVPYQEL